MSEPINIIQEEQEAGKQLAEAIERVLDFSEIHENMDRIERILEGMK